MKFIQPRKFRKVAIEWGSRAALILVSALLCLWMISGARASQIKDISINTENTNDIQVVFEMSENVAKSTVSLALERNFVQVSMQGASVYPAKTMTIKQGAVDKVFTYQYQPDVARARVLLDRPVEKISSKVKWEVQGNLIRVSFPKLQPSVVAAVPSIVTKPQAKKVGKTSPKKESFAEAMAERSEDGKKLDQEEEKIVQELLLSSKSALDKSSPSSIGKIAAVAGSSDDKAPKNTENMPIFAGTDTKSPKVETAKASSPARVIGSLLMVIAIFGALAFSSKKFLLGKALPFAARGGKAIEVLVNQSIAPKKSIAIIKVLDQYMVVGMSGDQMTLLNNLGSDPSVEKYLDDLQGERSFTKALEKSFSQSTPSEKADVASPTAQPKASIRNSIKRRLEGFKPL